MAMKVNQMWCLPTSQDGTFNTVMTGQVNSEIKILSHYTSVKRAALAACHLQNTI